MAAMSYRNNGELHEHACGRSSDEVERPFAERADKAQSEGEEHSCTMIMQAASRMPGM